MATDILTNITGKIRNLPNFYSEALLPVFEAVVNSIQSIDSISNKEDGEIIIEVVRKETETQKILDYNIGAIPEKDILGFKIIDNGVGFNKDNYNSFITADSTYKQHLGCKGLGRFSWLKAFDLVHIDSVYSERGKNYNRKIDFNENELKEVENTECSSTLPKQTIVNLNSFKRAYRERSSAYKTTEKIATRILEHTLVYFILGTKIQITVKDLDSSHSLNDMFSEIKNSLKKETIYIDDQKFEFYHLKIPSTHQKANNIVYCGNGRDVETVNIGKKIGISSSFKEKDGNRFTYTVYICSPYLDKNVNASRLEFEIPKKQSEINKPITMSDIERKVVHSIKESLECYINEVNKIKKDIVNNFVTNIDPSLRSVVKYKMDKIIDEIEPEAKDDKILEVLYKYKAKNDFDLKQRSNEFLKTQDSSLSSIKSEFNEISNQLEDSQKDSLANYVLWRKLIIKLFEKKLTLSENGKYEKEDVLHDIIFPRKITTDEISFNDHNLWLLDERLSFHEYAGSEKSLSSQSDSDSISRPDIIILHESDKHTLKTSSVSLIELKRPQREKIPGEDITKALKLYADRIKNASFKLPTGRNLNIDENANFYSFIICDLNEDVQRYARFNNFSKLPNEFGYYSYNNEMKLHMHIIGFDKILVDVKKRHSAFFDALKLSTY